MELHLDLTATGAQERFCARIRAEGFVTLRDDLIGGLLGPLYASWSDFFRSDSKHGFRPEPGRLDGYFPLASERALGQRQSDPKEFFHFYLDGVHPVPGRD